MAKNKAEKPWERQPKESSQAFAAFGCYCRMGAERSLSKVSQALHKSKTLLGRWSSEWEWVKRCQAYDNFLQEQELEQAKKEREQMRKRQAALGELLQNKAFSALKKLDPEDLEAKDLLRFIIEGAKLEALSRGVDPASPSGTESTGGNQTLADTITAAYKRRMEGEGSNDE